MNICVCVKQVEETYARTGKNPEQYFLKPEDRIFRINPCDEAAMMLASRAAAGLKNARIIVLTIGPIQTEDELWRIMAMGGEQLCHIELTRPDNGNSSLDSWSKAQVLANAVNTVGGDLVLCGNESIDRQNGLVANFLAHHLKRPFVSAIVDLSLKDGAAAARVTKSAGKGVREILDCRLPAVFSVDLFPGYSSMPSYEAKQQARQKKVKNILFDSRTLAPKTQCIG
ncbi:electron transfer flavoprotein subunit beta/FixA family protein [Thermodesulfobacteriota bacterium]